MVNIKSQAKRNRQNAKRRERNKAVRSELRTRALRAVAAAEAGDAERAEELLRIAQKRIDSAAASGVLHPNTAARRKASLHRKVSGLTG